MMHVWLSTPNTFIMCLCAHAILKADAIQLSILFIVIKYIFSQCVCVYFVIHSNFIWKCVTDRIEMHTQCKTLIWILYNRYYFRCGEIYWMIFRFFVVVGWLYSRERIFICLVAYTRISYSQSLEMIIVIYDFN